MVKCTTNTLNNIVYTGTLDEIERKSMNGKERSEITVGSTVGIPEHEKIDSEEYRMGPCRSREGVVQQIFDSSGQLLVWCSDEGCYKAMIIERDAE